MEALKWLVRRVNAVSKLREEGVDHSATGDWAAINEE